MCHTLAHQSLSKKQTWKIVCFLWDCARELMKGKSEWCLFIRIKMDYNCLVLIQKLVAQESSFSSVHWVTVAVRSWLISFLRYILVHCFELIWHEVSGLEQTCNQNFQEIFWFPDLKWYHLLRHDIHNVWW